MNLSAYRAEGKNHVRSVLCFIVRISQCDIRCYHTVCRGFKGCTRRQESVFKSIIILPHGRSQSETFDFNQIRHESFFVYRSCFRGNVKDTFSATSEASHWDFWHLMDSKAVIWGLTSVSHHQEFSNNKRQESFPQSTASRFKSDFSSTNISEAERLQLHEAFHWFYQLSGKLKI